MMSMKKIRFVLLLYFLLLPVLSAAHAVISQASSKIPLQRANQANILSLQFNSAVEAHLAQFFLISTGDKQQKLTVQSGKQQGELIVMLPALHIGKYALKFKLFAADSHLTEDTLYFRVK